MNAATRLIRHPCRQVVVERHVDFSAARPGTSAGRVRLLTDYWREARDAGLRLRHFDMAAFRRFVEARGENFDDYLGRINIGAFQTADVMSLRFLTFGHRHKMTPENPEGAYLGDFGGGAVLDAASRRYHQVRQLGVPLLVNVGIETFDDAPIAVVANLAVIPLAASGRRVTGIVTCSQPVETPARAYG